MTPAEIAEALARMAAHYRAAYSHPDNLLFTIIVVDQRDGKPAIGTDLDSSQMAGFFDALAQYYADTDARDDEETILSIDEGTQ